jgi:WhiB family transcriptional regulator, redox-sensing transcriptional regulator
MMSIANTDWVASAACLDQPNEWFFPITSTSHNDSLYDKARSVCARCPVIAACLDDAIEGGLTVGFFAGTTPHERKPAMRAAGTLVPTGRKKSPCGTVGAYRRHVRAGEKPCLDCKHANRIYNQDRIVTL